MCFAQCLDEAAGESVFCQGRLKLVVVLQVFALLRSHVGLQKNLVRIVGLRSELGGGEKEKETGQQNRTDSFHAMPGQNDNPPRPSCNPNFHLIPRRSGERAKVPGALPLQSVV